MPFAASDDEIESFLHRLTAVLDTAGDEIALDVTHGPRELQFLVFSVALYLSALGKAWVSAAYYGLLRGHGHQVRLRGGRTGSRLHGPAPPGRLRGR